MGETAGFWAIAAEGGGGIAVTPLAVVVAAAIAKSSPPLYTVGGVGRIEAAMGGWAALAGIRRGGRAV